MKLRYIGPHTHVDVRLGDELRERVPRGGTLDVPKDVAAALLEQSSNWEKVEPPAATSQRTRTRARTAPRAPRDATHTQAETTA